MNCARRGSSSLREESAPCGSVTTWRPSRSGSRLSINAEAKVAQEGIILTESQLAALEKAKQEEDMPDREDGQFLVDLVHTIPAIDFGRGLPEMQEIETFVMPGLEAGPDEVLDE